MYDFDSLTTGAVLVRAHMGVLFVTLNRPDTRNALAPEIVQTLGAVLERLEADTSMRALVLRGNGGVFCSGGSVGNFQARLDAGAQGGDPVALRNREFGRFMQRLAALPLPTLAIVEGAAMGGGLGLACVADVVLATADARFALTETSLGIIPAQIAPYVAARVGAQTACRLGLTGERVSGETALRLRLVDELAADSDALDELLAQWLTRICSCAPNANRALKPLLQRCADEPADVLLDAAALVFAQCMRDEGVEGIAAFRAKRAPAWGRRFGTADVRQARVLAQPLGERSA